MLARRLGRDLLQILTGIARHRPRRLVCGWSSRAGKSFGGLADGRILRCGRGNIQLLQIAVGNVMAAPVWNGIELDAVGELHFVLFVKPPDLLCPPGLLLQILQFPVLSLLYARVVCKFELFGVWELGAGWRWTNSPSSLQPYRGVVCRIVWPWGTGIVFRGGIHGGREGVYGEDVEPVMLIMRNISWWW
jgi:hypothetical protein